MFSTITIVITTPFIFDVWDIEMLSDNRVHFRNGNRNITLGNTAKRPIISYQTNIVSVLRFMLSQYFWPGSVYEPFGLGRFATDHSITRAIRDLCSSVFCATGLKQQPLHNLAPISLMYNPDRQTNKQTNTQTHNN